MTLPTNDEIVEKISDLFAGELGLDEFGPDVHFIFAGGDSLNAESLVAAVAAEFGIELKTSVLIDAPTPRDLAAVVESELPETPST